MAGCAASDPPGDLYVQVSADDEVIVDATQEAAAEWRACGSRQVYVTTLPGQGLPLRDRPAGRS
ncbi:MAG: hypothetical protein BGO98_50050 [Myxococcales bacterium 68-20]|nr:hypothetical protein [Myxococcales bacterium]OJY29952.1 MAG: hypothetical protein BGO98_50050 [Myxococcales bacterium 68-20]